MKKRFIGLALCLMTTIIIAGCGQNKSGANTSKNDNVSSEKPESITVAIWDEGQKNGLQQIMDEWSKESSIKVNIDVVDWSKYWSMVEEGAANGNLPDVFWMHSNVAQMYMENGALLDLSDRIANSDKIELKNYYQGVVNLYQHDGKQYAVPKDIDTIALWYNKTIFDEMGVEYPNDKWTWNDFAEAAARLTNEDHWGTAIRTNENQEGFYNTIYSMGGYVISNDKKSSGFDDPNTIKAITLFTDMIAAGSCPDYDTVVDTNPGDLFKEGKTAMAINGSWMLAGYRDNEYIAKNCDIAVLPFTNDPSDRVSIYNGLGWAAAADGKNADAAWSLIEFLGSKEAQIMQAKLGVTMSAYVGTSDDWVKSVDCFDLNGHMQMLDAKLVFRPYSKNTVVWEDLITEKLKDAWTGERPAEDVCKDIAKEMNEILANE